METFYNFTAVFDLCTTSRNTLTALISNCNCSCVHGVEPFLLLPVVPEPPPQERVADSISSCRSRSMRRSVSSIA
ncbi:hypothetical protein L798_01239 [Zootermopsis nevadensis]|uniref:Uncharacterized protein n=1 Tax=Zootermopsis nevadensis TaxID=136037 RepID=A0A067QVK0_ZOONE|nr:hypothetical protein L798_01239 [Zootermopsis nevadensis]